MNINYTGFCLFFRCGKFIFLLSPEFPESPRCDFLLKFAHALSPGMALVIYMYPDTLKVRGLGRANSYKHRRQQRFPSEMSPEI